MPDKKVKMVVCPVAKWCKHYCPHKDKHLAKESCKVRSICMANICLKCIFYKKGVK